MKPKSKRKSESNSHQGDALRLLYFRRIFDLTQKQAADLLDVPQSSYRAYEGGRLPIPIRVRRRIGLLSPVDILPMNPDQDPKDVYAVVRLAHPDEFCDELKRLLPTIAASKQKHPGNFRPVQRRFGLGLVEVSRKNREYVRTQRRELPPLRRLYCEWRDATFFASAIFTFLWVNCLQFSIPLGIFTDAANAVGLGSLAVFFLLFAAVSQDLVSNTGEHRTS